MTFCDCRKCYTLHLSLKSAVKIPPRGSHLLSACGWFQTSLSHFYLCPFFCVVVRRRRPILLCILGSGWGVWWYAHVTSALRDKGDWIKGRCRKGCYASCLPLFKTKNKGTHTPQQNYVEVMLDMSPAWWAPTIYRVNPHNYAGRSHTF